MLGELFAYWIGRSVGRSQCPRRRRRPTPDQIALERLVLAVFVALTLMIVLASLLD